MSVQAAPWQRARAIPFPDSVSALNALLGKRKAPDRRLSVALVASYGAHALVLTVAVALSRGPVLTMDPFATPGKLNVMPVYGVENPPPGPAARTVSPRVTKPRPAPAPPPPTEPAAVVPPPPEPEVAKAEDLLWREARPTPQPRTRPTRATPEPRRPSARASAPPPAPKTAVAPAGSAAGQGDPRLPSVSGPKGSPIGSLEGSPDGGFSGIVFGNLWYASRVRDLIYANWGDPYTGRSRPPATLQVVVAFRIHRDGTVSDIAVRESSGDVALDRSGLRAVEHARLPPLPADYSGSSLLVMYRFQLDPQ